MIFFQFRCLLSAAHISRHETFFMEQCPCLSLTFYCLLLSYSLIVSEIFSKRNFIYTEMYSKYWNAFLRLSERYKPKQRSHFGRLKSQLIFIIHIIHLVKSHTRFLSIANLFPSLFFPRKFELQFFCFLTMNLLYFFSSVFVIVNDEPLFTDIKLCWNSENN